MLNMKKIFYAFYTFTATEPFVFVYLLKEKIFLPFLEGLYAQILSVFVYATIMLICAWVCIMVMHWTSNSEKLSDIQEIAYADELFLPVYLGYFFVALGLPSWFDNPVVVVAVYLLVFVLTLQLGTAYYNPLFLLLGYRCYSIINKNKARFLLITKHRLKMPDNNTFEQLARLNDYAFIDIDKRQR